MPDICLYAQVHQPFRVHRFRVFDIGTGKTPFDDRLNAEIVRRVAEKCYRPTNVILERLIHESDFRLAMSLTGTLVEQLAQWDPETLESFQRLVATGRVELLGETYHHSLASLASPDEFRTQVESHRRMLKRVFGVEPRIFRNTELIYWDGLAPVITGLGFQGALVEGADHVLGWRSPNYTYHAASRPELRLLARNYRLSDDVGFRFSQRDWDGWPLTARTYADWLADSGGEHVLLGVDYETFGEHQWKDTGIFEFLAHLPEACRQRGLRFVCPSDLAARRPVGALSFERPTSWADQERDLSAWLGNRIQQAAHERLYRLRESVARSGSPEALACWRRLSTSDHIYYMCTKWFTDGDVHKYFSPYDTPYDAFVAWMNVVQDLEQRVRLEATVSGAPVGSGDLAA
jgi:alpha-amylase